MVLGLQNGMSQRWTQFTPRLLVLDGPVSRLSSLSLGAVHAPGLCFLPGEHRRPSASLGRAGQETLSGAASGAGMWGQHVSICPGHHRAEAEGSGHPTLGSWGLSGLVLGYPFLPAPSAGLVSLGSVPVLFPGLIILKPTLGAMLCPLTPPTAACSCPLCPQARAWGCCHLLPVLCACCGSPSPLPCIPTSSHPAQLSPYLPFRVVPIPPSFLLPDPVASAQLTLLLFLNVDICTRLGKKVLLETGLLVANCLGFFFTLFSLAPFTLTCDGADGETLNLLGLA